MSALPTMDCEPAERCTQTEQPALQPTAATPTPASSYTVDFERLSYTELKLPFVPSAETMRICIGRKGKHMIHISQSTHVAWIYYNGEQNAFAMYGEYDPALEPDSSDSETEQQAASPLFADFERAKRMILNHLAFHVLYRNVRAHCPASADELCWASEYIKQLPVIAPYAVPCWKPSPYEPYATPPSLPIPECVLTRVDESLRTSDWLPHGCTLRYDPVAYTLSTVIRAPRESVYRIAASDDFAWSTTTALIEHTLAKTVSNAAGDPHVPVHLYQWAHQFMQLYGGI